MTATIKSIVRQKFDEVITARRPWVVDDVFDEGVVAHDPGEPEPIRGRDVYRNSVEEVLRAFPNGRLRIDDQLAEGDKVVTRWTFTGTYEGVLFGVPPRGLDVEFGGIDIHHVSGGRIVEEWSTWDALGLMLRLGIVAETARSAGR